MLSCTVSQWDQSLGKYNMTFSNKLDDLLCEGKVARARTHAIRTLNSKAKSIADSLSNVGMESEVIEASDNIDSFSRVESQFGKNKYFDHSQVVSITVHDVDDYVVELPVSISISIGLSNYNKLNGLRATKTYLKDVLSRIRDVYSKLKSKI